MTYELTAPQTTKAQSVTPINRSVIREKVKGYKKFHAFVHRLDELTSEKQKLEKVEDIDQIYL